MDSGHVAKGESLEHDYNILQFLTPSAALGIMDDLLSFEVSWLGCSQRASDVLADAFCF